jgi:tetratricopeptide (TPR) repeat protein
MDSHDVLKEEVLAPIIDNLMATEYAAPPPNLLVSPQAWKQQKREELVALFSGQKEVDRINSALEVLKADFQANLSEVELEKLREEWESGTEKITHLLDQPLSEPIAPLTSLKEMMKLSETTMGFFYSVGVKFYKNQDFIKAADVFFLLSLIDAQRYNIWISLGLSEMKIEQFESALNAFAMASLIKKETPYPYYYSAECCSALGRAQEGVIYLTLAKEAVKSLPLEEREVLLSDIRILEQKSKL